MPHSKPLPQTIQQLLMQSIAADHVVGTGEDSSTFALTGFGDDHADHRFVIRVANNVLPADFPVFYPYPRVGSVESLLAGHTTLTPAKQVFTQGNVGQVIASVAGEKGLLPIRIHLRQEGKSLAQHIAHRREHYEAQQRGGDPDVATQCDALAKVDVMNLLMKEPHTLLSLVERTAQLGVQGVKFLDPHTGNILLDSKGYAGFVDVVNGGGVGLDSDSSMSRANVYMEQLRTDLLQDFAATHALKDESLRSVYCSTMKQFGAILDQAIAQTKPLIADRTSRLYHHSAVLVKPQGVSAVSLTDSPRSLLEQLDRLAGQVEQCGR